MVSATFLLPVLAAGASECDFSAFFDVSAPPCARSSTGDAQSAISGYASGRRYAPHDSDHAECEGVSNTTPCSRIFVLLYSGYLPPYIFENFSSYKIPIFVKFCMSLGDGSLTNICRNCDFLRVRF